MPKTSLFYIISDIDGKRQIIEICLPELSFWALNFAHSVLLSVNFLFFMHVFLGKPLPEKNLIGVVLVRIIKVKIMGRESCMHE